MFESNTKNIVELEDAFNQVMAKWGLGVYCGIVASSLRLEEGFPWFEAYGYADKSDLPKIFQDLSNEMNIKVVLHHSVSRDGELNIYGAFDINPSALDKFGSSAVLPTYSDSMNLEDLMDNYEQVFFPE